ncbi:unnamed protein product, partial [Didymodactylos carnosus]
MEETKRVEQQFSKENFQQNYLNTQQQKHESNKTIKPCGLTIAVASYAQQRIWLHEKLYFQSSDKFHSVYNLPIIFKIKCGKVSIQRLRMALLNIIYKYSVLRTSVKYNSNKNQLEQNIKSMSIPLGTTRDADDYYQFQLSKIDQEDELKILLLNEKKMKCFDIENGIVFRCHLIKYHKDDNNNDSDSLYHDDFIIFNYHHIVGDITSYKPFITALQNAYENCQNINDEIPLQYIDYTIYEQQLFDSSSSDINNACLFWKQLLNEYDFNKQQLQLPYDYHLNSLQRSGYSSFIRIELDLELVEQMINYKQLMNISFFQLCLTCYYLLIYKMTQEKDLCIGIAVANRYRSELQSMLGMFVNLLPYRYQLNPSETFSNILGQVKQRCLDILQYSYLPYQKIIALHRHEQQSSSSQTQLIQTTVQVAPSYTQIDVILDNNDTVLMKLNDEQDNSVIQFDLSLSISYNQQ